ncbi:PREDICTED: 1-phosphatidylinositol-3-phosphate 5-kinase FAB1B-like [Camelina sativa]|uniref:1-phosphatidylinositol-3-phosphate 5-kinase n=1 Tax=Camelina sativa TaxID=90675 RepID=A0ABM0W3W1_CAMSA|nr:PREDICTED: 1-phosphatidylinositol-3-phosphate 5-kinase FAB1B-like [Camelina sativa]
MGTRDSNRTFSEIVSLVKSWLPWRSEPATVSRDFWMPDQSCRVCYECDSQFTLINRRHHCRLCGRVFCGKCTSNSIPFVPTTDLRTPREEWERIRVCNYCFRQWEHGDGGPHVSHITELSTSPSETSLLSSKTSTTANSSSFALGSMPGLVGPYQRAQHSSDVNLHGVSSMETSTTRQGKETSRRSSCIATDVEDPSRFALNRSDDEYDEYIETCHSPRANEYYGPLEYDEMSIDDGPCKHLSADQKSLSSSPLIDQCLESLIREGAEQLHKKDEHDGREECEAPSPADISDDQVAEPVDFENNGLLWVPPDPENEEDERESALFDEEDNEGDASGEWGYLRPSTSFGSGDYRGEDHTTEEHKKAMKNVVDGHFRALLAQLLQVENIPVSDEEGKESWLEIITSLSWEAANLLKPDMSKSGGMDPGGYVKVKCLASGFPHDSKVVKGVVCKKNVAHRRMSAMIEKARILILGGGLEYQRVSNQLSSFDTLLQQEKDHLKMAVAKIHAERPNILLVEKSVSRFAQEYLLAKDISLVLNIKRPLLERIARCTGAQIIPSVDHLSSQKLGNCENFRVDRFLEEHGSTGQVGKKVVKTLMYFENCPKPLGFTILLRGASEDELKKVKHVVQYGVFAAYHLALETSFLADEGASPELPLNSPITVALPDKSMSIERSISTVPGFTVSTYEKSPTTLSCAEPQRENSVPVSELLSTTTNLSIQKDIDPMIPNGSGWQTRETNPSFVFSRHNVSLNLPERVTESINSDLSGRSLPVATPADKGNPTVVADDTGDNSLHSSEQGFVRQSSQTGTSIMVENQDNSSELTAVQQQTTEKPKETQSQKEEFPPSPSDHQSILVSLSSRSVWKGTVCERSHLFRIKYYGSFDKPLGRFLRDHLFDQSYRCRSCEMPSEAHVHCYTHRQGSLTISVKKLQDYLLPGEKEGKIWMWHRCLRCPRPNGFPPATLRVVMSDAAWGLSFGKFLELSFSNHAAASRVACCGHSLHRDCLRFYGFGNMVACFRYATIDVHSVYLPPSILSFNYENQDWIQRETDEVIERAELLFSEVLNAISQIAEKGFRRRIGELEEVLQREKAEFEENMRKMLHREGKEGQPLVDILELYRIRRQLLFQSYMWDHRLINASTLHKLENSDDTKRDFEKPPLAKSQTLPEMNAENNSLLTGSEVNLNPDDDSTGDTGSLNNVQQEADTIPDLNQEKEDGGEVSPSKTLPDTSYPLENKLDVRRTQSDGQIVMKNLSATLDAAWIGERQTSVEIPTNNKVLLPPSSMSNSSTFPPISEGLKPIDLPEQQNEFKVAYPVSPAMLSKNYENSEDSVSWLSVPFLNFYRSINKNFLLSSQKLDTFGEHSPIYISSFREAELQGGPRLLLPVGLNDIVVPVYDDEPTSMIAYALMSPEYQRQTSVEGESLVSYPSELNIARPVDDTIFDPSRSTGSVDESILSMSSSRSSSLLLDPLLYTKALHARVSYGEDGTLGKVKYTVTCYYAKRFEALRGICLPSELEFIRSLSRCKKWGAQGGKSNVFFAKTLDDRFIIKQVTKTELESFIKFAPAYFKYLSESISTKSPTCLAKILGIYQVATKQLKSGKETKMDVLIMENLLFGRTVKRLYDLKGSSRARYNPDSSGSNKVLLDQNLIEAMPTCPIFVGNKAKRLLERAVWNDTAFLALGDVMDYSLLVGVDEEKNELVLGIIDFLRQYTWDKHLESWVKFTGILGGPKNEAPTVISPKQYKRRFRKAMTTYFLMVPDQWSPPTVVANESRSDQPEETSQAGTQAE